MTERPNWLGSRALVAVAGLTLGALVGCAPFAHFD